MALQEIQTYPYGLSLTAYKKTRASLTFNWHYHQDWELTLTLNASGERYVGTQIHPISRADLLLTRPGTLHTWNAKALPNTEVSSYIIMVPSDWFDRLGRSQLGEFDSLIDYFNHCQSGMSYSLGCIERAKPIIEALCEEKEPLLRFALFVQLLHYLTQDTHAESIGNVAEIGATVNDSRLGRAIEYISRHYQQPLSLEQVAIAAGFSCASLKRHFQKAMQMSFSQFIQHLRIGYACYLLQSTSKPIDVIANESGYNNVSLFHRHFKVHKKLTPSRYRQQLQRPKKLG
ncbi:AraC family transcriptional regulator [Vibrio paucivorans]|uniref:AraC family transcriptional regulator n=1 Tax=Vibrio paucivorans TaxID=2829489 RepID=A0A9X3HSI7_9VIBR|nr:AraC family transcriptional regulator [Vibrio paucivorans]MCW8334858.1 AraC family transcriptional regulator [Vibrio paucivorans]